MRKTLFTPEGEKRYWEIVNRIENAIDREYMYGFGCDANKVEEQFVNLIDSLEFDIKKAKS